MQSDAKFDAVASTRRLLREAGTGALATILPGGAPYASLVAVATLPDGAPLLLLSQLARHSANISADPSVSLLIAEHVEGDPLAAVRLSLSGRIGACADTAARRRFLARHPEAAGYVDFADFAFWRIEVAGAHLVAGFGRIVDLAAGDFLTDTAGSAALLAAEEGALEHMNRDHVDAIELYATRLLGERPGSWRMIGIDPDGCDLMSDGTIRRLEFPQRVTAPDALRKTLAELAQQARG